MTLVANACEGAHGRAEPPREVDAGLGELRAAALLAQAVTANLKRSHAGLSASLL
jgi:hypothetical protein